MNRSRGISASSGVLLLEHTGGGVVIHVLEYHGAPLHLCEADLAYLGIRIRRRSSALSYAQRWASKLTRSPDAEPRGPSLLDPEWTQPTGVQVEGLLFVPVHGGLDLYVTDYQCDQVLLGDEHLRLLGLHLVRESGLGHDQRGD